MRSNLQTMAGSGDDGVSVHSGFPNPALEWRGQRPRLALDLNQLLVQHPSSTYLFRISGHRWSDQGIYDGDIAVIDRAARRRPSDLVIIWEESTFSLCRQRELGPDDKPWGAVTAIIHQYQ